MATPTTQNDQVTKSFARTVCTKPGTVNKRAPNQYLDPIHWQEFAININSSPEAYAKNTLKACAADIGKFASYCETTEQAGLPASASAIAGYIKSEQLQGRAYQTIERAISSIRFMHEQARLECAADDILVKNAMREAARTLKRDQKQQLPVRLEATAEDGAVFLLSALMDAAEDSLTGLRDQLLLSLGFDLGIRGAELAAVKFEDFELFEDRGEIVGGQLRIRKTKTRQEDEAPPKNVSAITAWLIMTWAEQAGLNEGPILRSVNRYGRAGRFKLSVETISVRLKALATAAGYHPDMVKDISSHSFRIGHAQDLHIRGADFGGIMLAQDWKSPATVLNYLRKISANRTASADMMKSRGAEFSKREISNQLMGN